MKNMKIVLLKALYFVVLAVVMSACFMFAYYTYHQQWFQDFTGIAAFKQFLSELSIRMGRNNL